jgi:hypothetical protein
MVLAANSTDLFSFSSMTLISSAGRANKFFELRRPASLDSITFWSTMSIHAMLDDDDGKAGDFNYSRRNEQWKDF